MINTFFNLKNFLYSLLFYYRLDANLRLCLFTGSLYKYEREPKRPSTYTTYKAK